MVLPWSLLGLYGYGPTATAVLAISGSTGSSSGAVEFDPKEIRKACSMVKALENRQVTAKGVIDTGSTSIRVSLKPESFAQGH